MTDATPRTAWYSATAAVLVLALAGTLAGGLALARRWPLPTALVCSHLLFARLVCWLAYRSLSAELEAARERMAMWNGAKNHNDLAEVGPVTPPRGVDEMDVPGFMVDSDYRPPRMYRCNNIHCGQPAAFHWERGGFPFTACERCIELWFPDGVPDWVTRLAEVRTLTATITGPQDQVRVAAAAVDELIGLNAGASAVHNTAEDDPAGSGPRSVPGRGE